MNIIKRYDKHDICFLSECLYFLSNKPKYFYIKDNYNNFKAEFYNLGKLFVIFRYLYKVKDRLKEHKKYKEFSMEFSSSHRDGHIIIDSSVCLSEFDIDSNYIDDTRLDYLIDFIEMLIEKISEGKLEFEFDSIKDILSYKIFMREYKDGCYEK